MKLNLSTKGSATSSLERQQSNTKFHRFLVRTRKNWQLHMLMVLPIAYLCLFDFAPLYGLQMGFREFRPRAGIWGSEWVGLKHFIDFMTMRNFGTLLWNTLAINLYQLFCSFPVPIILALMIHICPYKKFTKLVQNVAYVPHFISTVVMVGIMNQLMNPVFGVYGNIYRLMGGIGIPTDVRAVAGAFRHLYVWSGVWQGMGWSSILYVAALAGVSSELHEAAELDGATRLKRVWYVDLPAIAPTICIKLIMQFGSLISVGYQKVYLMQNDLNLGVSEVISTYVFKYGLGKMQLSFGTAVGLWNSAISTCLVILVNWITNKLSDGENGLF